MRVKFTKEWNTLSSNSKSMIISIGAIALATSILFLSKVIFPSYDFSQLELVVITAIGGFVTNIIKNYIKVK